jgi:flavin reductase (DIM6/NTAB) family NADH-FMN oxidoreductase RutF
VPLDPDTFRSVLGRFASGVTIVTTRDPAGHDHGMTVSAFCSLSLEPPQVLICIDRAATMYDVLVGAPTFAVNILSSDQEALSRRFSTPDASQRFDGVGFTRGSSGDTLIDDAIAYLECRVVNRFDGGDHCIFVGEIEAATARDERPLLYYRGGYAQLER